MNFLIVSPGNLNINYPLIKMSSFNMHSFMEEGLDLLARDWTDWNNTIALINLNFYNSEDQFIDLIERIKQHEDAIHSSCWIQNLGDIIAGEIDIIRLGLLGQAWVDAHRNWTHTKISIDEGVKEKNIDDYDRWDVNGSGENYNLDPKYSNLRKFTGILLSHNINIIQTE